MPLARDFFKAFHQLPTSEGLQARVGPLLSYLYHFKGVDLLQSPEWSEDIEEFMTSIENQILDLRKKTVGEHALQKEDLSKAIGLAEVYNNMVFILGNIVNEAQNGPISPGYSELLKFAGADDTFITFNWDTLLDRALAATGCWSPNDGYGFEFARVLDGTWKERVDSGDVYHDRWKLLKLHGSTNWLVPYRGVGTSTLDTQSVVADRERVFLFWQASLPTETYRGRWRGGYETTCYGYYPPDIPTECWPKELTSAPEGHSRAMLTLSRILSPFEESSGTGVPSSPLLLTPVRQKRYEDYASVIKNLWRQAGIALSDADRVVIIGYSFPRTDTRSIQLIENTLGKKRGVVEVWIVDPNSQDIASRLATSSLEKAKGLRLEMPTFQDLVGRLWKTCPNTVKAATAVDREFGDWVKRLSLFHDVWPPPRLEE